MQSEYKAAAKYFCPGRYYNSTDHEPGGNKTGDLGRIHTSSFQAAATKSVNNHISTYFPFGREFFSLKRGYNGNEEEEEEDKQVALEEESSLMEAGKAIHAHLNASNFYTQLAPSFYDFLLGTGAIQFLRGDPSKGSHFVFCSVPVTELYLESGSYGEVGGVFRKFSIKGRDIRARFSYANAKLRESELVEVEEEDNLSKDFVLIEATVPSLITVERFIKNKKYNADKAEEEGENYTVPEEVSIGGVEVQGFKVFVYLEKGEDFLYEADEETNPWLIFRHSQYPGEVFGRGPCLTQRDSAETLNEMMKYLCFAAERAVNPPLLTTEEDLQDKILVPGSITLVESNNPSQLNGKGRSFEVLPSSDPNLELAMMRKLQEEIEEAFHKDAVGPIDSSVRTATDVSIRQQELDRQRVASTSRIFHELLFPLVRRAVNILSAPGIAILDLIPDGPHPSSVSHHRINGLDLAVQIHTPLHTLQEQSELNSLTVAAQIILPFLNEQSSLFVDQTAVINKVFELLNLPPSLRVKEEAKKRQRAIPPQQV